MKLSGINERKLIRRMVDFISKNIKIICRLRCFWMGKRTYRKNKTQHYGNWYSNNGQGREKTLLASIRHRPGIPKIFNIRFGSFFNCLGALVKNQSLIEKIVNSADSGLVEKTVDFDLTNSLYDVLRPVMEKLRIFEDNSANMADYIPSSIDILTFCLQNGDVINKR